MTCPNAGHGLPDDAATTSALGHVCDTYVEGKMRRLASVYAPSAPNERIAFFSTLRTIINSNTIMVVYTQDYTQLNRQCYLISSHPITSRMATHTHTHIAFDSAYSR